MQCSSQYYNVMSSPPPSHYVEGMTQQHASSEKVYGVKGGANNMLSNLLSKIHFWTNVQT